MKKRQIYKYSLYGKVGKISLCSKQIFKPKFFSLQIQKNVHHPKGNDMSQE